MRFYRDLKAGVRISWGYHPIYMIDDVERDLQRLIDEDKVLLYGTTLNLPEGAKLGDITGNAIVTNNAGVALANAAFRPEKYKELKFPNIIEPNDDWLLCVQGAEEYVDSPSGYIYMIDFDDARKFTLNPKTNWHFETNSIEIQLKGQIEVFRTDFKRKTLISG